MAKTSADTGRLTPELLLGLMAAHGIKNPYALAKVSGISPTALSLFLSGHNKTLAVTTRRKLAVIFPGSKHLFVADIIGAEAT